MKIGERNVSIRVTLICPPAQHTPEKIIKIATKKYQKD